MLHGSTGFITLFFTAMLKLIPRNTGDKVLDSEGTLFQRVGITLKICKMELASHVLPLLMKPTCQIDFACDTGLVVCFRDDIEDGELRVSFEESFCL